MLKDAICKRLDFIIQEIQAWPSKFQESVEIDNITNIELESLYHSARRIVVKLQGQCIGMITLACDVLDVSIDYEWFYSKLNKTILDSYEKIGEIYNRELCNF